MRKKPAQQRRWLTGRTGRLWHIRPETYILERVADKAGVTYRVRLAYPYPTGGRGSPTYFFDADDAHRAAPDIISGAIELDPTWRTDSPEGRWIHRRRRFTFILAPVDWPCLTLGGGGERDAGRTACIGWPVGSPGRDGPSKRPGRRSAVPAGG